MIPLNKGQDYARLLTKHAQPDQLLQVFLFGSIVLHGAGNDLDIIIEVPEQTFLAFSSKCIGTLDGYHPITAALLPLYSQYWVYESPAKARLDNALTAIDITAEAVRQELRSLVPDELVDMLCLPVGWQEPGYADGLLTTAFGFSKDPNLLKKIIQNKIRVT